MGFRGSYQHVTEGSDVSAANTSRAPRQLGQDLLYLYELIKAEARGSALFMHDVPVESSATVGMAVYYHLANARFERALATINDTLTSQATLMAESANAWGIVVEKNGPESAKLLIAGYIPLDFSAAVQGSLVTGLYFLSTTSPGKLTSQKPGIAVPVLMHGPVGHVLVFPHWTNVLDRHTHYMFRLQPQPCAASVTIGDNSTTFNSPDAELEGWLPANHAVFEDSAPEGAKFGYNWQANPELASAWPPIPLHSASLEIDLGTGISVMGQSVPLGPNRLAVIDNFGIWWMSDYDDDRPWPVSLNATGHTEEDWYENHPTQNDSDPRETAMALTLWFSRPNMATDKSLVTSLHPKAGGKVSITCLGSDKPAFSGDLEIGLNLDFTGGAENQTGYLAVKTIDGETVNRGPVCEGLFAGTGIQLTSDAQRDVSGNTLHMGKVSVGLSQQTSQRELQVSWTKLLGTMESYVRDVPCIMFPAQRTSGIRSVIHLPARTLPDDLEVVLLLQIAGNVAGTLPDLTFRYRRIPRAPDAEEVDNGDNLIGIPTTDTTETLTLSDLTLGSPFEYATIRCPPVSAHNGDMVVVTIERSAADAYAGNLYVLQMLVELDDA